MQRKEKQPQPARLIRRTRNLRFIFNKTGSGEVFLSYINCILPRCTCFPGTELIKTLYWRARNKTHVGVKCSKGNIENHCSGIFLLVDAYVRLKEFRWWRLMTSHFAARISAAADSCVIRDPYSVLTYVTPLILNTDLIELFFTNSAKRWMRGERMAVIKNHSYIYDTCRDRISWRKKIYIYAQTWLACGKSD